MATRSTTTDVAAVATEAAKTKETADRLANGDYPEDADHVRVLAGMVKQLADQMERLASATDAQGVSAHDREVVLEEDQTPERAPAQPLDDRSADEPPLGR